MTLLKELKIDVLPATNIFAKRIEINGFFGAEIFENRDFFFVHIGNIFCLTEADLRWQLKSLYGCDLTNKKTIEGFMDLYQNKIHGQYISHQSYENILDKFNQ